MLQDFIHSPFSHLVAVFVVYFTTLLLVHQIIRHLVKVRKFKETVVLHAFLKALPKPLFLIFSLMYLKFLLKSLELNNKLGFLDLDFQKVISVISFIILTSFLFSWKTHAYRLLTIRSESKVKIATWYMLSKTISALISLVAFIILLNILNINLTALWTIGGVGAAAIAFASKDVIGNLFGGLTLILSRPFGLKDHVIIPGHDIDGWVKEIGWYLTLLDNQHKELIYVPNQIFTGSHLINLSRRSHRYIDWSIGLRYEDLPKTDGICKAIEEHLCGLSEIDKGDRHAVILGSLEDSSVNIHMRAYSSQTQWREFQIFKHNLLLKTVEIIREHGAEFPFPTRTILIDNAESNAKNPLAK